MSTESPRGGPAFPSGNQVSVGNHITHGHPGMTLRDYFAAHASDADVEAALERVKKVQTVVDAGFGQKRVVMALPAHARQIARYMHADDMLLARQA